MQRLHCEARGGEVGDFLDEVAGTVSRLQPPANLLKRRCGITSRRAIGPAFQDERPCGCVGLPKSWRARANQEFMDCCPLDPSVGFKPERPVHGLGFFETALEKRRRGPETCPVPHLQI